jgi:hypothetical protein
VTGRRGRRRRKLLDDFKESRRSEGGSFGPVVRQTTNE